MRSLRKRHGLILASGALILLFHLLSGRKKLMDALASGTLPLRQGLSRLCALFPFSVAEILCTLGVLAVLAWLVWTVVSVVKVRPRLLTFWKRLSLLLAVVLLLYLLLCVLLGASYRGSSFQDRSGLRATPQSVDTLREVTALFAERLAAASGEVPRNADGVFAVGQEEIFAAAKKMYHAMGPETAAFIDMMLENDAFDVDSRKNKWGGGYCTEFPKWKQPFILANFNGTAGDVDVVTHEAGHALNAYLIADNRFALELGCGGMETAETHSMSMEFFAWPYMESFFGEKADAYRFMHALESFSFLPYGTIVDAFQHVVYEHPEMTPAERNKAWLELEAQYRPHISLEGIPFIEEGRRWQYQMHIYEMPFYYIDYCLAQTAAFCFLLASLEDYDDAFAKYIRFSRQGGEKLWTDLLKEAGFASPFEPGATETLARRVEALLEKIKV